VIRSLLFSLLLFSSTASAATYRSLAVTFYQPPARSLSACGPTKPGSFAQLAVSRDLRRALPCGTRVQVTLRTPKGGVRTFRAVVWDSLGPASRRAIDVKVTRSALRYGRTTATVRVLSKPGS